MFSHCPSVIQVQDGVPHVIITYHELGHRIYPLLGYQIWDLLPHWIQDMGPTHSPCY